MIKNLIFDLGNVLVEFKPSDYLKRINIPENEIEFLVKLIFKDKRWTEFDRGTITIEDYLADLKCENPHYSEYIDIIFCNNWPSNFLKPKKNSINFLKEMSAEYNIYILSNISKYVLDYVKTLDFFEYVSGGTYSYEIRFCKPEFEIYDTFLKKYRLKPEECLFLDDLPTNIEAARKFHINGIVFHDNFQEIKNFLNQSKP